MQAADLSTANYERGRQVAARCASCHGPLGRTHEATTPRLAGQQASYIAQQLQRMREGAWIDMKIVTPDPNDPRHLSGVRRMNRHMSDALVQLSDVDVFDVAIFYAAQSCGAEATTARVVPPQIVGRCQTCHGISGISTNPHVPSIAGQNKKYLEMQILAFRDAFHGVSWGGATERGAKIMQGQAKLLSDQDIAILAAYYAGLPCAP